MRGALHRSLHLFAQDPVVLERRRDRLAADQPGEIEHQFHIPVSGTIAAVTAWTFVDLEFDVRFYYAPEQRDSPLMFPHVLTGAYFPGVEFPPEWHASVTSWDENAQNCISGCRLAIGLRSATAASSELIDVQGYIHASFQGYGAPTEFDDNELDA